MSTGAYPHGYLPFSAIDAADDPSTPNPLSELITDQRAEFAYVLAADVLDRQTAWEGDYAGAEETVYLSSHGYASLGDGGGAAEGVPDHKLFPAVLESAYSFKVNLIAGGAWQASALPGFGTIAISNPDNRYEYLLRKNWERRRITVWVGRRQWIGPSFSTFGRIFRATVDRVEADLRTITVTVRDMRDVMEVDANPTAYLGFGSAVRLSSAGHKVTVAFGAAMNQVYGTGVLMAPEIIFQAEAPLRAGVLYDRAGVFQIRLYADGAVGAQVSISGAWEHMTSAPNLVAAGEVHRVTAVIASDGPRGKLYLDGAQVASNLAMAPAFTDFPSLGITLGRPYP